MTPEQEHELKERTKNLPVDTLSASTFQLGKNSWTTEEKYALLCELHIVGRTPQDIVDIYSGRTFEKEDRDRFKAYMRKWTIRLRKGRPLYSKSGKPPTKVSDSGEFYDSDSADNDDDVLLNPVKVQQQQQYHQQYHHHHHQQQQQQQKSTGAGRKRIHDGQENGLPSIKQRKLSTEAAAAAAAIEKSTEDLGLEPSAVTSSHATSSSSSSSSSSSATGRVNDDDVSYSTGGHVIEEEEEEEEEEEQDDG